MKQLFWRNILTWLPSLAVAILASEVAIANPDIDRHQIANIQPFDLVQLAYQGYFQDQGIPSYSAFRTTVENQQVTATTLIESAIKKGRLYPDALNKQDYVSAVEAQLELILTR